MDYNDEVIGKFCGEDFITEFYSNKTCEFDEIILNNGERKNKYKIYSNLQDEFTSNLSHEQQKMYYDVLEKHMMLISKDFELTFKFGFKYGEQ